MIRLKVVGGEIIEIRPDEKCVYLDDGVQIMYDELSLDLVVKTIIMTYQEQLSTRIVFRQLVSQELRMKNSWFW